MSNKTTKAAIWDDKGRLFLAVGVWLQVTQTADGAWMCLCPGLGLSAELPGLSTVDQARTSALIRVQDACCQRLQETLTMLNRARAT